MVSVESPVKSLSSFSEKPQVMTGGEAKVEMLKRNGVDTIFALPGVQLDGLFNAFYDRRDEFRIIHTRHEQATAYMADGFARVTGREGICLVVPGPGLLNTTAALSTAYACSSPVVCLTGQIRSDLIDFGRGLLHEIPNQIGMIRSVTKAANRAMSQAEIPDAVNETFRQSRLGRRRPVELEVPPDILLGSGEVTLLDPVGPVAPSALDPDAMAKAAKALANARTPLIYVGGGALRSASGESLVALAEMLQAPVIVSSNGKGVISDRNSLAQTELSDPELRPKADVVLTVGTRFIDSMSQSRQITAGQTLIQLEIDPAQISLNQKADIELLGDADVALRQLVDLVASQNIARADRTAELEALKRFHQSRFESVEPQASFGRALREELPDDGILVSEMTQLGYWSSVGYPVYSPNTFLTAGYQGTLGFGFTMAMGAKVGKPDVPVVSINGDGGFGFTLNELSTLVQHNIPLVTVVFNDTAYGNVRRMQFEDHGGKPIASELVNPDYQMLARAFGIAGYKAEEPGQLQMALRKAIAADEPALIEVPVGVMPNPWTTLGLR